MRRLEDLIAEAPVFAGLDRSHLEFIAGCGSNEHGDAGRYLFREGEPAGRFYLIRKGTVAVEIAAPGRPPIVIETLHAGDVTGLAWLFEPHRSQFDVRVSEAAALTAFDGVCLRAKCEADHELGYQLMRRFAVLSAERLEATRLQLLDVYANPGAAA